MKSNRIVPDMDAIYRKRKKHISQGGNWVDPHSKTTLKTERAVSRLSSEGLQGKGNIKDLPDKLAGNKERRRETNVNPTPKRNPDPVQVPEFSTEHRILTKEEFQRALPRHLRGTVSRATLDKLNSIHTDPVIGNEIKENFISYSLVLTESKYSVMGYLDAVVYVSYKMMGYSNKDAYARTFPERMARLRAQGIEEKNIAAHVTSYNKGKLVNAILERTLVPTWVLNQDLHQKAINRLAHLMMYAHSEKVQSDSASALLGHLKPPEPKEVNLNIGAKEDQGLLDLKEALLRLAQQQKQMIDSGISTQAVASQKLIEGRSEVRAESRVGSKVVSTRKLVEEAEYDQL